MATYTTIPEEARPLVEEPSKCSQATVKKLVVVAAFGFLIGAAASTAVSYRKTATQLVVPTPPKPPAPAPAAAPVHISMSGSNGHAQKRTIPGGHIIIDSMNDGCELTINGDVLGDLHVVGMNGGSKVWVTGKVTGGVITGSLNGGSSIEVAHGCGKAPTADSLNGGSYIAGAGCDLSYG